MLKKVFWRQSRAHSRPETPTDKELAGKLSERIASELPVGGRNRLRFYVRDGVVTIYGSVLRLEDRLFVKGLVGRTPGVRMVYDHLTVER